MICTSATRSSGEIEASTANGPTDKSQSFHEIGRLSAKYVQRTFAGIKPKDLPVEGQPRAGDQSQNSQTNRPHNSAKYAGESG